MMLNIVCIMGRLAKDPEMRQTTSGKSVASFRVACDRGRKDANGQSVADWIDVVAWEKSAEFVCRYFQKGSMIAVDGRLQSRQYQDKNGNNRTAIEIVANNINFCGPKIQNAQSSAEYAQERASAPQASNYPAAQQKATRSAAAPESDYSDIEPLDDDGDLPF